MYVLMLRDGHDNEEVVGCFISRLVSHGVSRSSIFWDRSVCGYVFLDCSAGVMSALWSFLQNDSAIDNSFSYSEITSEEFGEMFASLSLSRGVNYGDIVLINRGYYAKLFGIILRSCGKYRYVIGLNFCCGVSFVSLMPGDFSVVDNIFNIIKVPL